MHTFDITRMRALYLFVASLYFSVKLINLPNLASYGNPGDTQNEPQKKIFFVQVRCVSLKFASDIS
jgi:hypothetical protein